MVGSLALGGTIPIELFSLNTIVHEQWDNTFARGRVSEDRYWETVNQVDQLPELEKRCANVQLRIVLTHHPVCDPTPKFGVGCVLANRKDVALNLSKKDANGCRIATIVLSGHTHQLFPRHGTLPTKLPSGGQQHSPLADGQVQLTVGTLSQRGPQRAAQAASPSGGTQTWQLLRFWDEGIARQLVLERIVYIRPRGIGPFAPLADNQGHSAERMIVDY
jgi:hypothetical protein